jgi:hypothetical protein
METTNAHGCILIDKKIGVFIFRTGAQMASWRKNYGFRIESARRVAMFKIMETHVLYHR